MSKKKILVVDDETAFTDLVKLSLEETNKYMVGTVNDAKKAFETIKSFRPDLVLLDIMMPDLEGSYIAEQMRHDTELSGTPIIFVTATITSEETSERNGIIGGHPFLAKPVTVKKLIEHIEKYIR